MKTDRIARLGEQLREFARERDWERFHSPKNLAMALTVEAAELQEKFQWLTEDESRRLAGEPLEAVKDELADVFLYTLRMAQVLGVDLLAAAEAKMVKNARKYPVDKARSCRSAATQAPAGFRRRGSTTRGAGE